MAVTVTWPESSDGFVPKHKTTRHTDARSFAVGTDGVLHLFDYAPSSPADSREQSTLAHTIATYAKGEWIKAVRR